MPEFTVRVELHEVDGVEPSPDDYESLHWAMQQEKYFRVIMDDKTKIWYHLPPAEYTVTWNGADAEKVCDDVEAIVAAVWSEASVLVTHSSQRRWVGLLEATDKEVEELTETQD